MMLIQRQILPYVEKTISEYPVTLITGARQVGKTTLVTMIEKKHGYTYFSFDDTDLMKEAKENPKLFLKKPWFAQVTWQMVSCDIITFGQQ